PRRFSARFGHPCWCANLRQNPGHHAAHLSRRHPVATPFPRTVAGQAKRAGQNQLVHGARHDQTPPFKLLGGADMHLRPQQILFEKAVAVFMGEAVAIARRHFARRQLLLPHPDKPAFARIAFGPLGSFPQDAKHGHLDLSGLPDVQVLPRLHREWFAAPIGPVPRGIGVSPRFGATALKEVAVFARRPSFAWWTRRSWSV